jgi:hypothetical protein
VRKTRYVATRGTRGTKGSRGGAVRGVAEPIARYGSDRGEVALYRTADGSVTLDVRLERETTWLTQAQMADLFETTVPNISMHVRNVFKEKELRKNSVVKEFLITAGDSIAFERSRGIWERATEVTHSHGMEPNCVPRVDRIVKQPTHRVKAIVDRPIVGGGVK